MVKQKLQKLELMCKISKRGEVSNDCFLTNADLWRIVRLWPQHLVPRMGCKGQETPRQVPF